jgi:hypothetical protein
LNASLSDVCAWDFWGEISRKNVIVSVRKWPVKVFLMRRGEYNKIDEQKQITGVLRFININVRFERERAPGVGYVLFRHNDEVIACKLRNLFTHTFIPRHLSRTTVLSCRYERDRNLLSTELKPIHPRMPVKPSTMLVSRSIKTLPDPAFGTSRGTVGVGFGGAGAIGVAVGTGLGWACGVSIAGGC